MLDYNKSIVKDRISQDQIFDLLTDFGGEPQYTNFGIISTTICHNMPGEGSRKLYYYNNSNLFHCYTGCSNPSFDIFELVIKIMDIQYGKNYDLNDAVRYVASYCGIAPEIEIDNDEGNKQDWKILEEYNKINSNNVTNNKTFEYKHYDPIILDRFNYNVKLTPWLNEGISQEVLNKAQIGFFPGGSQITIPHFDKDGNLIGIRGRTMIKEEAENYGKYRPLVVGKTLYNHSLGHNLYGLNWAKDNIKRLHKVFIFESEKSVLKYMTYFGIDNNLAVGVCGSSLSASQVQLLQEFDAQEIIFAFDKQYKKVKSKEAKEWKNKLLKLRDRYKNDFFISIMWDKQNLLGYKDSPIDCGKETFLELYKERIVL